MCFGCHLGGLIRWHCVSIASIHLNNTENLIKQQQQQQQASRKASNAIYFDF